MADKPDEVHRIVIEYEFKVPPNAPRNVNAEDDPREEQRVERIMRRILTKGGPA